MSKMKKKMITLNDRRGVPDTDIAGSWDVLLLHNAESGDQCGIDQIAEQLQTGGLVISAQTDVGDALFARKLKSPGAPWALLGKLKGQPWLYLLPSWDDHLLPPALASKANLTVLYVGHQDTSSATFVQLFKGDSQPIDFQSVGYVDEGDPGTKSDTLFRSDSHQHAWLKKFSDEFAAQSALVAELGAYAPNTIASAEKGVITIGSEDEDLEQASAWEHIDLLKWVITDEFPTGATRPSTEKSSTSSRRTSSDSNARKSAPKKPSSAEVIPEKSAPPTPAKEAPARKTFSQLVKEHQVALHVHSQPRQITLKRPRGHRWNAPEKRDAVEVKLLAVGFKRIGLFVVDEMPDLRLLTMLNQEENVYAVIGESDDTRFTDIIRMHKDGTGLTVTNFSGGKQAKLQLQKYPTMRHPGGSEAKLMQTLRNTPPPRTGPKPVSEKTFAEDYQKFYKAEMAEKRKVSRLP